MTFQNIFIQNLYTHNQLTFDECDILFVSKKEWSFLDDRIAKFTQVIIKIISISQQEKFLNFDYIKFPIFQFSGLTFNDKQPITFCNCEFYNDVTFADSIIEVPINFRHSTFFSHVKFIECVFKENIDFRFTTFEQPIL